MTRPIDELSATFVDVGGGHELLVRDGSAGRVAPRRAGERVLVQVEREPSPGRSGRATARPVIVGRRLVLSPWRRDGAVSRRLAATPEEAARLAAWVDARSDPGKGFVARAAAHEATPEELDREAARLLATWDGSLRRAQAMDRPGLVLAAPDPLLRAARDAPADVERVMLDDAEERARLLDWLAEVDRLLASRVALHAPGRSLLADTGLGPEIAEALQPRIPLASGGRLIIEPTAALVAIDVDTGRAVRGGPGDATIAATNLEAASEIARQLRLRNLGGPIVIDFVATDDETERERVREALVRALTEDPLTTRVVGWPPGGMLQLVRRRRGAELASRVASVCPAGEGRGRMDPPELSARGADG